MGWTVDEAHTSIGFSAKHLGVTTVRGRFTQFASSIELDHAGNPESAKGTFEVKTASLDTGNEKRDEHLRSADFFDVEKYPNMTFKINSVQKKSEDEYEINGDLAIKDTTKPVVLAYEHSGAASSPWGDTRIGGTLTATLNRTDWNLTWNVPLSGGGFLVSEKVKLEIDIEMSQSVEVAAQAAQAEAKTGA